MSDPEQRARVALAQVRVDAFTELIADLVKQRDEFMDKFGRCGRWLDGHSYNKCRRLRGHEGEC